MDNLGYGYGLAEAEDKREPYYKAIDKAIVALEEGDTDAALAVLKQCQSTMNKEQ